MKKVKRLLAMILVVAALCATGILTTGASAADVRESKAQVLSALGLFKGYDDTGTNFGLAKGATREHAILFLIRMLGEEKAAAAWKGDQPYSDVPAGNYYYSYIGYAKDKGYTNGVGSNKFGLGQSANMKQMTTFALRGLGYSDTAGDFTYQDSLNFAKTKGILESATAPATFTRGDAVDVIFGATFANVKNQSYTLLEKLAAANVVTEAQVDKAEAILDAMTTTGPTTTETASKVLTDRFNKAVTRYNSQLEYLKALGVEDDAEFTKQLNELTAALDKMGKVIGEGTGIYTDAQIKEYNSALDTLDQTMNAIDVLITAAKDAVQQPAARTIQVNFVNGTTANFTKFVVSVDGGKGTDSCTVASGKTQTFSFEVGDSTVPFHVSFVESISGTPYTMDFTFDKSVKTGATLTVTFGVDAQGNVVYS